MTSRAATACASWLSDIQRFSQLVTRVPLRPYQIKPAQAIIDSIIHHKGRSFAVMMSRQAGKNELSGQLEAYILNLYQRRGGQIVKASPTFKPQTINSILRLTDRLDNPWTAGRARRREGYMVQLGKARALFFSAEPSANVVGATADLLLECDEAQAVTADKWNKDFRPMAASTNATTVMWGTAWTSDTLLAQTILHLNSSDPSAVFLYDASCVGSVVPNYAAYVRQEVARLGRQHPLIKTQYYLETIDAQAGLFSPNRRALMRGSHDRRHDPEPGHRYALLLDVGGEDETAGGPSQLTFFENRKRDATALTIVDVDIAYGRLPIYRVVDRRLWLGVKHTSLHTQIVALGHHWRAVWIVVDATGVGAGLTSFLVKSLGQAGDGNGGGRVLPVVFSSKVKSNLGWDFVAIVETGRFADYAHDHEPDTDQFWHEVEACQYEVRDGPGNAIKWGVAESIAYDGRIAYGHDDLLISAALTAILDKQEWPGTGPSEVVYLPDDLEDIDRADW